MKTRFIFFILFIVLLFLSDFYTLKALETTFPGFFQKSGRFRIGFWVLKGIILALLILSFRLKISPILKRGLTIGFFSLYAGQFMLLLFSFADEIRRISLWAWDQFSGSKYPQASKEYGSSSPPIPRSEFLAKTGLGIGSMVFLGMGLQSGSVYDYRVRDIHLHLPNLPAEFEGMQIAQISDIHSGSFYNEKAVALGLDLLLSLKPEMIFFTGDLVNSRSDEMKDYQSIFSRLKAPLGVFSILGNHDYGDYAHWTSQEEKFRDHEELKRIHKLMGYDLILNSNRKIKIGKAEISLLGVENWSATSDFPKYGRMDLAIKGTENSPVKLLLSHDPSHWRGQILSQYPEIDAMFSGHTHGMQMGIRLPNFQWSPIQYYYPEWAGLYKQGSQQLYVNVGYGFIGYPGRIGMYPEISRFTLSSRSNEKG